jgi:hypothetical protein
VLIDHSVNFLLETAEIEIADEISKTILLPNTLYLNSEQVEKTISGVLRNFGGEERLLISTHKQFLHKLREADIIPADEFDRLVAIYGPEDARGISRDTDLPFI